MVRPAGNESGCDILEGDGKLRNRSRLTQNILRALSGLEGDAPPEKILKLLDEGVKGV